MSFKPNVWLNTKTTNKIKCKKKPFWINQNLFDQRWQIINQFHFQLCHDNMVRLRLVNKVQIVLILAISFGSCQTSSDDHIWECLIGFPLAKLVKNFKLHYNYCLVQEQLQEATFVIRKEETTVKTLLQQTTTPLPVRATSPNPVVSSTTLRIVKSKAIKPERVSHQQVTTSLPISIISTTPLPSIPFSSTTSRVTTPNRTSPMQVTTPYPTMDTTSTPLSLISVQNIDDISQTTSTIAADVVISLENDSGEVTNAATLETNPVNQYQTVDWLSYKRFGYRKAWEGAFD
jgi:hypothetical protein